MLSPKAIRILRNSILASIALAIFSSSAVASIDACPGSLQINGSFLRASLMEEATGDTLPVYESEDAIPEQTLATRCAGSCGADLSFEQSLQRELLTDRENAGEYLEDTAITGRIKSGFLRQKDLDSLDISVKTVNGVVTLTGNVTSRAQIARAEDIARESNGVIAVVNKLTFKN